MSLWQSRAADKAADKNWLTLWEVPSDGVTEHVKLPLITLIADHLLISGVNADDGVDHTSSTL